MEMGCAHRSPSRAVQVKHKIKAGTFCYVTRCWREAWIGRVVKALSWRTGVLSIGPDGTMKTTDGWLVVAPWMDPKAPCWICPEDHLFPIHQLFEEVE
jgi:hypothetical protein